MELLLIGMKINLIVFTLKILIDLCKIKQTINIKSIFVCTVSIKALKKQAPFVIYTNF